MSVNSGNPVSFPPCKRKDLLCPTNSQTNKCDLWLPLQKTDKTYSNVRTMVEFAMAMMSKLDKLNQHAFNNFKLRIGELI